MIARVAGVPVEEIVPLLTRASAGLVAVRAWIMVRLRRRREPGA